MRASILRNAVILIAMLLTVFLYVRVLSRVYVLNEENERTKGRVEQLQKDHEELKVKIALLKNDPAYLEKVAREELGMIKQDEKVYRFEK